MFGKEVRNIKFRLSDILFTDQISFILDWTVHLLYSKGLLWDLMQFLIQRYMSYNNAVNKIE